MDIWITKCRKRAKCLYCPKMIENGDYMVVGKMWKSKEGEARRWTIRLHWHPLCWINQAVEKLDKQPPIETRGRKKMAITAEQNKARVKIMMRRAAVLQRIRVVMNTDKDTDKLIHLGKLLNQLKEEITPLGGVPKSWT